MTCPTCAGGRQRAVVTPSSAQAHVPGAALVAAFGITPQHDTGHSDERGTIDLNIVLEEAAGRVARTAKSEQH